MYSGTTLFVAIIHCQITCCRLSSAHKIGSAGIAVASPYYLAIPQDLHDPQIKWVGFRVSQNTHRAPPFRLGGARARISQQIFKEHPHYPDILSLQQDCPSLASVSGTCSLLDGMCAIAMGSFLTDQPDEGISSNRADRPVW